MTNDVHSQNEGAASSLSEHTSEEHHNDPAADDETDCLRTQPVLRAKIESGTLDGLTYPCEAVLWQGKTNATALGEILSGDRVIRKNIKGSAVLRIAGVPAAKGNIIRKNNKWYFKCVSFKEEL